MKLNHHVPIHTPSYNVASSQQSGLNPQGMPSFMTKTVDNTVYKNGSNTPISVQH